MQLTPEDACSFIHSFIVFIKNIRQNADEITRVVNITDRQ